MEYSCGLKKGQNLSEMSRYNNNISRFSYRNKISWKKIHDEKGYLQKLYKTVSEGR
jgi:hypothetical protein